MESSSYFVMVKEGKEVLIVQLIRNEIKQPILRVVPNISCKGDLSSALSMIQPQFLMIQDVRLLHWKDRRC